MAPAEKRPWRWGALGPFWIGVPYRRVGRIGALQEVPGHQRATPPSRIMLSGAGLRPGSAIPRVSICLHSARQGSPGRSRFSATNRGWAKSSASRNSRSAWSQNSTAKHLILLGVVRASNPRVGRSEPLRARQTVLPGSRSISRPPLILTRYGRKQGNGGTRNAGVIHAATWEPPRPLDGSFSLCRASARAGRPSADVETDKIRPRITSC
jgi:hypothetical protein